MKDVKSIVAKNITELRVAKGLTQLELAEKLNYSDKAVSKWERAESLPGISTIVEMAELFGVSLDDFVREDCAARSARAAAAKEELPVEPGQPNRRVRNRAVITAMSVLLVWFVALLVYVTIDVTPAAVQTHWLAFIYAVPISTLVWLILNTIWFNPRRNYLIISVLMWSCLAALHLTFLAIGIDPWQIYLLGIPGQIVIILWSLLGARKKKGK